VFFFGASADADSLAAGAAADVASGATAPASTRRPRRAAGFLVSWISSMWFVLFLEYFSDSMFLRFSLAALAFRTGPCSFALDSRGFARLLASC
jgi:hypothetical protein